jgi:hypothetical protein
MADSSSRGKQKKRKTNHSFTHLELRISNYKVGHSMELMLDVYLEKERKKKKPFCATSKKVYFSIKLLLFVVGDGFKHVLIQQ